MTSSRICEAPLTSVSRVGQREKNKVVLAARAFEECPPVIRVHLHPLVGVWPVGVLLHADLENSRVDVDCIDMAGLLAQGDRHVGPGPCPDDQNVIEGISGQPKIGRPVNSFALLQLPLRGAINWWGTPLTPMRSRFEPATSTSLVATL